MAHMAAMSALSGTASMFANSLRASAPSIVKKQKAAILLWMGGGPASIDIWDLKPGAATGGPFKPIATSGDVQICEHMPRMAEQMHNMCIVRSMSTREADHDRGSYYMHTGHVPDPNIEHPSYGSIVAKELIPTRQGMLTIPPFVTINGGGFNPGFLGMAYAPFSVDSSGNVRNMQYNVAAERMNDRFSALEMLEARYVSQKRGRVAIGHGEVLKATYVALTSQQMQAFKVDSESAETKAKYGDSGFGKSCLIARRLVEAGVPFVEVDYGGWDTHMNNFDQLKNDKLPKLDQGMAALMSDLAERSMLNDVVVLWMGEFGRTPRINGDAGRDHWARSWSVVVGGAGIKKGVAVGQTNEDGTEVAGKSYSSEDLMASVLKSLDVPLETTYKSLNGRPMKIANGGKVIEELFG